MDTTAKPFDNVDVRTAAQIRDQSRGDRQEGVPRPRRAGQRQPDRALVKFASDPTPKYTYDVEKRSSTSRRPGLTSLKVDLSVADEAFNGAIDAAVLYQESAKAAGIDIKHHPRAQ